MSNAVGILAASKTSRSLAQGSLIVVCDFRLQPYHAITTGSRSHGRPNKIAINDFCCGEAIEGVAPPVGARPKRPESPCTVTADLIVQNIMIVLVGPSDTVRANNPLLAITDDANAASLVNSQYDDVFHGHLCHWGEMIRSGASYFKVAYYQISRALDIC
jgi:hypothetical protein